MTRTRADRQAFAAGVRAGFRSLLALGCSRDDPAWILRRHLGSPETDRIARHRDTDAFRVDVPQEK